MSLYTRTLPRKANKATAGYSAGTSGLPCYALRAGASAVHLPGTSGGCAGGSTSSTGRVVAAQAAPWAGTTRRSFLLPSPPEPRLIVGRNKIMQRMHFSTSDMISTPSNSGITNAGSTSSSSSSLTSSTGTSATTPTFDRVPTSLPRMDPPEKLFRERTQLPGDLAKVEGGLRRQQPWEKDGRWQSHKTKTQGDTGQLFRKCHRKGYMAKVTIRHANGKLSKRFPGWALVKDPSKDWGCVVCILLMTGLAVHACANLSYGENYWSRRRKAIRERLRLEYNLPVGWDNEIEHEKDGQWFHRGWEEDKSFEVNSLAKAAMGNA
ncbi:unnamed protein product [Amoebophrya sp. A120]|nr:unnamed protein product [Amoebophrya sp. A120]|eukprot:GSA120T00016271001.1